MFAEEITYFSKNTAQVSIIASTLPASLPLTSDPIENMADGYTLLPGSTVFVTTTQKVYMLGTSNDWSEV